MSTLSKSDFKVARTCATKLYYRKRAYPSLEDEDGFLELLAHGGYMVERLATELFPEGRAISQELEIPDAARETVEALRAECVTLFQAVLLSGQRLARADIIAKSGRRIDVIEVKSSVYDPSVANAQRADGSPRVPRTRNGLDREWVPDVVDAVYQALILRELLPWAEVRPFLLMPNKSLSTDIDRLRDRFTVEERSLPSGRVFMEVAFDCSPEERERLRAGHHFLTRIDLTEEMAELEGEIEADATRFVASLNPDLRRIDSAIEIACNKCEYRVPPPTSPSGFLDCWHDRGRPDPHVLDLYKVGSRGSANTQVTGLISEGKCALRDIDPSRLRSANGEIGEDSKRQRVQLWCHQEGREWVGDGLAALIAKQEYPLHFIDFEATDLAIPPYARLHPYDRIAFQWSCHTIEAKGGKARHGPPFLSTDPEYPGVKFARSLRAAIGDEGSVFMWHWFERDTVNAIREQMSSLGQQDESLSVWLERLSRRLVDLRTWCLKQYCHPDMGPSTSIKDVVRAVWNADPLLPEEFPEYAGTRSPYDSLQPVIVGGRELRVADGTAAVQAYLAMRFGPERHDAAACRRLRHGLLSYCRLDTAAMAMIWNRWSRVCDAPTPPIF